MVLSQSKDLPKKNPLKQLDSLPQELNECAIQEQKKSEFKQVESQDKHLKSKFLHPTRKLSTSDSVMKEIKDITRGFQRLGNSCENIHDSPRRGNKKSENSNSCFDLTSTNVSSSMRNRRSGDLMPDSFAVTANIHNTNSGSKSPKNNRSVLKTASSVGCLIKKKVLFDLRKCPEKNLIQNETMNTNVEDIEETNSSSSR